jgi:AcrR family transcriptional regulator
VSASVPRVSQAHEDQIRERIALAARRVFAERGFHRATIQDVVRESGLSVGAIYTYFSGKDELFLATCDISSGQGLGELANRLARPASTAERLAIAVAFFIDSVIETSDGHLPSTFLVQAWAEAEQEPAVREMLVRRREQLTTTARLLLAEGIARGDVPAWLDVEAMAAAATALLDGLILQRIEAGDGARRPEFERRARVIVELLLGAASADRLPDVPVIPPEPFGVMGPPRSSDPPRVVEQSRSPEPRPSATVAREPSPLA